MIVKLKQTYAPVVEAVQWTGFNAVEIAEFTIGGITTESKPGSGKLTLRVGSFSEGTVDFSIGDWVLKHEDGEFTFCSADDCVKHYSLCGEDEVHNELDNNVGGDLAW